MKPGDSTNAPERMLDWIVDHDQVAEVCARVQTRERGRTRRRRLAAGTLAAGLLAAGAMFWAVPYARDTETVATAPARRQRLPLKDGSQAILNAQTVLFADFRGDRRTVRLETGEAFFTVAKDAAHPFLVITPAGTVRVTGTKFNVRLADGRAEVTLTEGRVAFEPETAGTAPRQLQPGQQLDSGEPLVRNLTPEAMEETTAWRDGRAVFHRATLQEAVERFARYHAKTIRVSPEVRELRLGGSFILDDLTGFFAAVEEMLPARVVTRPDGSVQVVAAPRHPAG